MPQETKVIAFHAPQELAAAFRARAVAEDRSLSAELRRLMRRALAEDGTTRLPAGDPKQRADEAPAGAEA